MYSEFMPGFYQSIANASCILIGRPTKTARHPWIVLAESLRFVAAEQAKARSAVAILNSLNVPRFFKLLEAEGLLPEVERLLLSLKEQKEAYEQADAELTRISHRIALAGGMVPPRDKILQHRAHKESAARALKVTVEKVQELGCQVKDLEMGLVDFPTLYRGQKVYLCWKLGESGIGFWHHVEDGYRGRRPIDKDFLAHHRGETGSEC
jgi:hypothetical protein